VRDVGRSSLTTEERILGEDGRVLVEAKFGLVLWDPVKRASRPVTDEERASLTVGQPADPSSRP
jgi:hypothetical protein